MNKDSILIETVVHIPIDRVWESWMTPSHIMNWNNASDDWHTPAASNDLKVGGKFSYILAAKDGSFSFDLGGIYTSITEKLLLAYGLEDERKVKVEFMSTDQGVKVIQVFETETENSAEMLKTGWQAILNNFKKYTETLV